MIPQSMTMTVIKTKRAYETPDESDGYRILVDRLWPRGLTHERLDCQLWEKALAPSTQLREWFHAVSSNRWDEFKTRYVAELESNPELPAFIELLRKHPVVTFVYGSRDEIHNEATILQQFCETKLA
jgi:uncharacterized protein YeaO (DUF488 family)